MDKRRIRALDNRYYLLGKDEYGDEMWLEEASWDCGWYWGLGYVETFNSFKTDINSHEHYDNLFLKGDLTPEKFKSVIVETPLTDKEIWALNELMKSAYIARKYSDMLHTGGAHISSNPCKDLLQNEAEYKRINEKVIPGIMDEVYKLLTP